MKLNLNDPSDMKAMEPYVLGTVTKTATSYNQPGLPKPPAGWGKVIGFTDSVDGDDEGPESPDEL